MFLKVFSSNLRGSISVCSTLQTVSRQGNLVSKTGLFQTVETTFGSAKLRYSTEKPASRISKVDISSGSSSSQNEGLSEDEVRMLNQDPDNFGTLSSFKPLVTEQMPNESASKVADTEEDSSETKSPGEDTSKAYSESLLKHYEALMKDLIENKRIEDAVTMFESEVLMKHKIYAPLEIYEWLINECIHHKEIKAAFIVYDHMVGRRLKVSIEIIEKLIFAFELSTLPIRKVQSIQKILSKEKYEYKLNEKMYNALMRIYSRTPQWSMSLKLADEMKEHGFNYELETLNALMESCCQDRDNGFYRLLELWHELHHMNLTPNVHTFNAFLKGVEKCELNNVDKLKDTVESIRAKCNTDSSENQVNDTSKTAIDDGRPNLLNRPPYIGYLFPMGRVEKPEHRLLIFGGLTGFFHMLKHYHVQPTMETILALLNVVPNTFIAHQRVITLMQKNRIQPDMNVFNVLLTKNCLQQHFQNAMEIIEMMDAADVELDLVSYGLLAMSCTNKAESDEFFDVLKYRNIKLDVDIMNAMLKNACVLKNNDFLINIMRKMQYDEIEPTRESLQMVDDYQKEVFQSLRSHTVPSKKIRNECFKLSREYKNWLKCFRNDLPMDDGAMETVKSAPEQKQKPKRKQRQDGKLQATSRPE